MCLFKVLVCGGRDFNDKEYFDLMMNVLFGSCPCAIEIIHGGARGADTLAGEWAKERNISVEVYPADWNKYGKSAGYKRNSQMLEQGKPNIVVAFPGGKGTEMMVRIAKEAGVTVHEISPK